MCCFKLLPNFPKDVLCGRIIIFVLFILTFPISFLIVNLHTCRKYGLHCRHFEFWDYHFWCRTKILDVEKAPTDITTVMKRYMEKPPFFSYEEMKESIVDNVYINLMLEVANNGLPNMFFHVELSGSLSERFGKKFPSFSDLACDYNLMLVPSRLSVIFKDSISQRTSEPLVAINDLRKKSDEANSDAPIEFDEPYYWIQLENESHEYLHKVCLQFHHTKIRNGRGLFISSALIKPLLRKQLETITNYLSELEKKNHYLEKSTGHKSKISTIVEEAHKKPAINVKVKSEISWKEKRLANPCPSCTNCWISIVSFFSKYWTYCNSRIFDSTPKALKKKLLTKTLLDVDFILALPCPHWPNSTNHWFNSPHPWISIRNKELVGKLKECGLHFVPTQSRSFIEEVLLHNYDKHVPHKESREKEGELSHKEKMSEIKTKYPSLEWRLSFALPELIISDYVPDIVRWAYMILKCVIRRNEKVNGVIFGKYFNTYFLKNTLFHYMDLLEAEKCVELSNVKLPDSKEFNNEVFEKEFWFVFDGIVDKVLEGFQKEYVPHYWWYQKLEGRNYNMFNELRPAVQERIKNLLLELKKDKETSLSIISYMEADFELAHRELARRNNGARVAPKNQKETDKRAALRKYIYKGKSDEKLFEVCNCLPCGECQSCNECCVVKLDHNSNEKYVY